LAVTGDKGDAGNVVEKAYGSVDLAFLTADFLGDNLFNTAHDISWLRAACRRIACRRKTKRPKS